MKQKKKIIPTIIIIGQMVVLGFKDSLLYYMTQKNVKQKKKIIPTIITMGIEGGATVQRLVTLLYILMYYKLICIW